MFSSWRNVGGRIKKEKKNIETSENELKSRNMLRFTSGGRMEPWNLDKLDYPRVSFVYSWGHKGLIAVFFIPLNHGTYIYIVYRIYNNKGKVSLNLI